MSKRNLTCDVGNSLQSASPKTHPSRKAWRGVKGTAKRHIRTSDRAMFTMKMLVGLWRDLLRTTAWKKKENGSWETKLKQQLLIV